jgi:hypothetical protein
VNNKKSYLQMLRELLNKAPVEIEEDHRGNYELWVNTILPHNFEADTMEHAIEKAWEALCK